MVASFFSAVTAFIAAHPHLAYAAVLLLAFPAQVFHRTTAAASPCLFPPHPSGVQREQNKMHAEAHSRGATILGFFQITDQAED